MADRAEKAAGSVSSIRLPLVFAVLVFVLVLVFVVTFVFLFLVVVFVLERFFLILLEFIAILGDDVELNRMDLHDLEFDVAFRTGHDFAFFHFVFVQIDFRIAVGTAGHGVFPPSCFASPGSVGRRRSLRGIIYLRREMHLSEDKTLKANGEYPERPVVGVGGVVIRDGRALLIRRGHEPYRGAWSIPGGKLELGETIPQAVRRELKEETGLDVEVGELIEALERIERDADGRVRFHFLILDYRCHARAAQPTAGGDAMDVAFVAEDELENYNLSEDVQRVVGKAFAMWREGR